MRGAILPDMMSLSDLWKTFRLLTDPETVPGDKKDFLHDFLAEEYRKREIRRIEYLMKMSGIKRIKLISDFDWTFNPKIPRDKITAFMQTDWLKIPANLVIIGPAGVGKSHVATALCNDAVMKGVRTVFLSLFDLTAKLAKAKNIYSLIDYYAATPVLCLDELGYVMPSKDHADAIFQIVSKRTETGTTIVTTNLVPSDWGKIFDTATASAILDRLSLNGRFITFEGRSYRSRK
jgi:DNA replication protein DnaC